MNHDEFCLGPDACICSELDKARADERKKAGAA
jgi:hypothetical protein